MSSHDLRADADTFRALARSSPWRFRTLHFRHRSRVIPTAEAWLRRPGELVVQTPDRERTVVHGPPYGMSVTTTTEYTWGSDHVEAEPGRTMVFPHEFDPPRRPDGLVAERPPRSALLFDDPMYENFRWVAMLDPVELAGGVDVTAVRLGHHGERPALFARVSIADGYDPRCDCCALLFGPGSLLAPPAEPGPDFPTAFEVALDTQTGVVVAIDALDGDGDSSWMRTTILAVDEALPDALFRERR